MHIDMGGCQKCQNYGPFLGTLNTRCRIIIGTPKKRDQNFDNHPYGIFMNFGRGGTLGFGFGFLVYLNL